MPSIAINAFIGAKDDHVLLYTPTSSFTAHPFLMAKLPYDPNDLGPIARVSNTLVGLVVTPSLKIDTVKDFVAQVKAQPGKLNYATATGMTDVIFDGYFKNAGPRTSRACPIATWSGRSPISAKAASRPMSARSRSCSRTSSPAASS